MKKFATLSLFAVLTVATSVPSVLADRRVNFRAYDGAYLDPPYKGPKGIMKGTPSAANNESLEDDRESDLSKNDVVSLIANQSPIRSQASRGTCSIFSATAMLESMLIIEKNFPKNTDLSEEWLEYAMMRTQGSEGSSSSNNFRAFLRYGSAKENLLPYIGEDWSEGVNTTDLSKSRCGKVVATAQKACLLGHRDPRLMDASEADLAGMGAIADLKDPEFATARADAFALRDRFLRTVNPNTSVMTSTEVKDLLRKGKPVTMDIDFFYGAWNHREALDFNIGRDSNAWAKGIVGYPEKDSMDYKQSLANPAGHSILLVGYDDNQVVTTTVKMQNGMMKTFNYKGVYYFKNSWGTTGFGISSSIAGRNFPGYGTITQQYAEEYATFYKFASGGAANPRR